MYLLKYYLFIFQHNGHFENRDKSTFTSKGKKKNVKKSIPTDNESISSNDEELAEENEK